MTFLCVANILTVRLETIQGVFFLLIMLIFGENQR